MVATAPTLGRSNKVSVKTDSERADDVPERTESFNPSGRPSIVKRMARLADESKAFEIVRDKWTLISDTLADEALKAARSRKKDGKSLVATCTAAGIAYDKRWSKQVADSQEVAIPSILADRISGKVQDNQRLMSKVALLGEECDRYKMMLQAADEGMIGP